MIKLKDLISEGGKPRAGDYVRDKRTKELGKVNKIRGNRMAYVKFPSNKKSFLPMDVSKWKPSGNHNVGRTVWTEGLITEGGNGILQPVPKAKSQRDAMNYVKKFLKDEKSYGGDFANIRNVKFVGNVSSEDKLDKMGMRYEDRSAVVGVVDGEYWWSIWTRS